MKEYTVHGHFKLDDTIVVDAENDKEAEKLAKKIFWDLIKDHLSDKENISFEIKSRDLNDKEIVKDFKEGYIPKETASVKRATKKVEKKAEKEVKVTKRGRKPKEK